MYFLICYFISEYDSDWESFNDKCQALNSKMGNNSSFQFENLQINCECGNKQTSSISPNYYRWNNAQFLLNNWERKKIQPFVFIYLSRQSSISSYIQVFPQWKSFCLQPSKTISQKFQYPKILSFLFRQFILQKLMMAISKTKEE